MTTAEANLTTIDQPTPVWGVRADHVDAVRALVGSALVCAAYVLVASAVFDVATTWLEIVGTTTSLACVWLIRRQNVLSMPLGLVSVVAMGAFFFRIDLVGQGWLHLGYYVPIQILGWRVWIRGGAADGEKPVAWMSWPGRAAVVVALVAGTLALAAVFEALHGPSDTLLWDTSIVAASVAAQALLTVKRIESWWLWLIPVDVSAVLLYARTEAYAFAALYVLYLFIASMGLREWVQAWRRQQEGLTPRQARLAR